MKAYLIAWRNLWRNKKRTAITLAAILFAVFLSTFMSSMQEGTYSRMIENTVSFYTGYMQVHHHKYWETKSINDTYVPDEAFKQSLMDNEHVTFIFPRMESFTLLSTGDNTKASALIGIDPVKENEVTGLAQWIDKGRYLKEGDDGVLMGSGLAKKLKAKIGDTIVLMSVGFHGASAAALSPLVGILHFPSPKMNDFGAYVHIDNARMFYNAPDRVTSYVLMVDQYNDLNTARNEVQSKLDSTYKVLTWEEMQPDVVQMIEQDKAGGIIMKAIVYSVIGFGILGTIIMMMAERKKELAIMIAVGMQKSRLLSILFFETLYIGILGVLCGFVLSTPVILYLVNNPIPLPENMQEVYEKFGFEAKMFFSLYYPVFVNQIITIFIITMFVFIYPMLTIFRFKLIKTLRG